MELQQVARMLPGANCLHSHHGGSERPPDCDGEPDCTAVALFAAGATAGTVLAATFAAALARMRQAMQAAHLRRPRGQFHLRRAGGRAMRLHRMLHSNRGAASPATQPPKAAQAAPAAAGAPASTASGAQRGARLLRTVRPTRRGALPILLRPARRVLSACGRRGRRVDAEDSGVRRGLAGRQNAPCLCVPACPRSQLRYERRSEPRGA